MHWLETWYGWATGGRPHPVTDAAMRHVLDERPRNAEITVNWGDARLGNLIYDVSCGPIADPRALDAQLRAIPGVVETGLFVGRADVVLIARDTGVERRVR